MNDHYDIKKGSFYWHILLSDEIKEFPIINAIDQPKYDHLSGDGNWLDAYDLEYKSKSSLNELIPEFYNFFIKKGFTFEKSKSPRCNHLLEYNNGVLFTGISDKNYCLDLLITEPEYNSVKIEVSIIK